MSSKNNVKIIIDGDSKDFQKALDRANKSTKRYNNQVKQAKKDTTGLGQGFSQAANQVTIFNGQLDPISGRLSAIGTGIARFGVGMTGLTAIVGAMGLAMRKMVEASEAYEMRQNRFNALLKATSSQSQMTRQDLEDLANSIGKETLSSTEEAEKAIRVMLTFKKVQGETFKDSIKLARDMQVALGTDLRSATLQLGKALNDPISNMGALSRAGVQFNDTQKESIRTMWEMGDAAGAQAIILEELRTQVGGLAEAEGTDLANTLDLIGHEWDRMWERLGSTEYIRNWKSGVANMGKIISGEMEEIGEQHTKENRQLKFKNELVQKIINKSERLNKLNKTLNAPNRDIRVSKSQTEEIIKREEKALAEYQARLRLWYKTRKLEADNAAKERAEGEIKSLKANFEEQQRMVEKSNEARLKAETAFASGFESKADKVNRVYSEKHEKLKSAFEKEKSVLEESYEKQLEILNKEGATQDEKERLLAEHRQKLLDIDERFRELEAQGELGRQAKLQEISDREQARLNADLLRRRRAATVFANEQAKLFNTQLQTSDAESVSFVDSMFGTPQNLEDRKNKILEISQSIADGILASDKTLAEKRAALSKLTLETSKVMAQNEAQGRKQAAQDTWGALETLGKTGNKKLFAIAKAANIARAIMNTYTAATNAMATLPPPFGQIAAGVVTAAGLANVAQIRAQEMPQFHDGIDYVPRTGSYLIEKGERVVDSRLNADLKGYLQNKASNRGGDINLQIPDTGSYSATEQWFEDNKYQIKEFLRA